MDIAALSPYEDSDYARQNSQYEPQRWTLSKHLGKVISDFWKTWKKAEGNVTASEIDLINISEPISAVELLSEVSNIYIFENDDVAQFLKAHPFLISLLIEAHDKLKEHFPASELELKVISDPDLEKKQLLLLVRTRLSPEEAFESLNAFDDDWWLDKLPEAQNNLVIHVRPE